MGCWRPLIPLIFLSVNVSCATANPPLAASEDERTAATTAALICLDQAIPKIDDLRSDAATIAVAAVGMCQRQFATMDDAYLRQESPAVRRIMSAKYLSDDHLKMALRSVLAVRNRQMRIR